MKRALPALLIGNLALICAVDASAYDRVAAYTYATTWCNTNFQRNLNGNANHVNNSAGAIYGGPDNYTWWYSTRMPVGFFGYHLFDWTTQTNDNGTDRFPSRDGADCSNFASQVIRAGGMTFSGLTSDDDTVRGTFIKWARLHETLMNSANISSVTISNRWSNPSVLEVGDLVSIPTQHHMMVVIGTGTKIALAYHSYDNCSIPLTGLPIDDFQDFPLVGFHIIGNTLSASADSTAPSMTPQHADGSTISGFAGAETISVVVTDGSSGVQRLEAQTGAPVMNTWTNLQYGFASRLFRDASFYGASKTYSINLSYLSAGTTVWLQSSDVAGNVTAQYFQIDRTQPTYALFDANGATITAVAVTSMTSVTVKGIDEASGSGIDKITLLKPDNTTSTQTFSGQPEAFATFSSLSTGTFTAKVYDRANNVASVGFDVVTTLPPTPEPKGPYRNPLPLPLLSTNCVTMSNLYSPGVATVQISGPGVNETTSFPCNEAPSTDVLSSLTCGLQSNSTYTVTVTGCPGTSTAADYNVQQGTATLTVCLEGDSPTCSGLTYNPASVTVSTALVTLELPSYPDSDANKVCNVLMSMEPRGSCGFTGTSYKATYTTPCLQNKEFTIRNYSSTETATGTMTFMVDIAGIGQAWRTSGVPGTASQKTGSYLITDNRNLCPQVSTPTPQVAVTIWADIFNLVVSSYAGTALNLVKRDARYLVPDTGVSGRASDAVFSSSSTINLTFTVPSTPTISTSTLVLHRYDGVSWSSSGVTNQQVSFNAATGVISATGTFTRTGVYAALFASPDSSAPVTSISFQGSSSSTFDGALYLSTDSYAVLTTTDPSVDGYSIGVSSIYYRLDPTSAAGFFIYSSSVPLPLGFHRFEYYSVDYAGNSEAVHTSTFLVTAGTLFKASGRYSTTGKLLAGFLGSGALLDIESRAENDMTLRISSANGTALLTVSNIGNVGIGVADPSARLDITGLDPPPETALSLRSGNSIASTSSVQIAFGYNGEPSMRHALVTHHSTDTTGVGNRMDFYIWNALTPSTGAIAVMDLLALQVSTNASGGTVQVRPAGNPSFGVELIVSDGSTIGAGRVIRASAEQHSSRRLKTKIRYFKEADEIRAYEDVIGLKHASFLYRSEPAGAQPHRGPIFDDAPESIRGPGGSLSLDARLANAEMAIKEAARRVERLKERLKRLEQ